MIARLRLIACLMVFTITPVMRTVENLHVIYFVYFFGDFKALEAA